MCCILAKSLLGRKLPSWYTTYHIVCEKSMTGDLALASMLRAPNTNLTKTSTVYCIFSTYHEVVFYWSEESPPRANGSRPMTVTSSAPTDPRQSNSMPDWDWQHGSLMTLKKVKQTAMSARGSSASSSIHSHSQGSQSTSIGGMSRFPIELGLSSSLVNIISLSRSQEVLFCVFTYLDTRTLALAGGVCRQWYHLSRQPTLWRRIRIANARISGNNLYLMRTWCTEVRHLTIERIQVPKASYRKHFSESTEPAVEKSKTLEAALESFLKTNSATLVTLKIIDCKAYLEERSLWHASIHCSHLEKLVYLSDHDPLGAEVLWALGKGCPRLTALVVSPLWPNMQPNKFNDRCCHIIARSWPFLQVLCIGGKSISEDGLLILSASCPKLRHLEIDHGPEITEAVAVKIVKVGLRGLERLDISYTPITPRAVMQFNSSCPKLVHIGIQAGISDFYPRGVTEKAHAEFDSLVNIFEKLRSRAGFYEVLHLKFDK